MSQFLQHESRDNDPHLHVHVPIAQVAQTGRDGSWRTPDTFGYNTVFPAVSGIGSVYLEALLTQRFGVEWVPRACTCEPRCADASECTSAFGCEIRGIPREVMDLFSSRRDTITTEVRARVAEFEREHGRKPTQRELTDIHASAWQSTRHGKKEGPLCPRARPAPCASSTTTGAAAPWPTWPPGTSTAARSPAGASISVVQRKALTPNDFTSLAQIRDRLAAFETRYNAIARPFSWKFTRADLNDLLRRIDSHNKTQPNALAA